MHKTEAAVIVLM